MYDICISKLDLYTVRIDEIISKILFNKSYIYEIPSPFDTYVGYNV